MDDCSYMKLALSLAEKGLGHTSPNPMVGAVIVKDGRIIGQGYHKCYGGPHAEREALSSCTEPPKGAAMYVTLEPCCHHGKQPPCTDAILESGISRVVIGSGDPNPLVAGKGIALLRRRGIAVTEHILEKECAALNQIFFHYIRTGKPYVAMKYAMTMDGKIAAYTGASKWITGEEARSHVQTQRLKYRGIMVGLGTVLADDPLLTCRIEGGINPIRIVCDTRLRTPLTSQIAKTAPQVPTILATCCADPQKQAPYQAQGITVLTLPEKEGRVDLQALMAKLGEMKIDGILLEGGAQLNWAALESGIVRKVLAYLSPKILGGNKAKSPVGGMGVPLPGQAYGLTDSKITRLGEDFLIESEVSQNICRESMVCQNICQESEVCQNVYRNS